MNRLKTIGFVLIAAMAALALAQDTFSIKRTGKVGDEHRFKLEVKADFGGQAIEFSAVAVEKVTRVEPNGALHLEATQQDVKVKFGDQEMEVPQEAPTTTVYNADGTIAEIRGDDVDASSYRLANATVVVAPAAPVKVGDKWTHTFKADDRTGAVAAKVSYEVLAAEKWRTFDTVKVRATFEETEGDDKMTSTSTAWLDVRNFSVVRVEAEVKKAPLPGVPEPVDMTVRLERI